MRLLHVTAFSLVVAACSSSAAIPESGSSEDAINYRSSVGREYAIKATTSVTLAGDDAKLEGDARLVRAKVLAREKVDAITAALNTQLMVVIPEAERTTRTGMAIMLRANSFGFDDLVERDGNFGFAYKAESAGSNEFLKRLEGPAEGTRTTQVTLGAGESAEKITISFIPEAVTGNAYPQYREMFKDGLDIGIHIGGDHNTPRGDIPEAKATYDDLLKLGLKSPVASFEKLALDSGPLTGTLDVAGTAVAVRATLYHQDMITDGKFEKLVAKYKESAKVNDIVVYRGHAGLALDYSGVAVSYNPRVALKASEFKDLELPEKYQVFVFDGCETYYGYADKLYENPKKNPKNMSVVTAANFAGGSTAEATRAFLRGVLDQTPGTWLPNTWDGLLTKLNDPANAQWMAIYGVHGIEDSPKVSPLADVSVVGKTCATQTDCGSIDSRCVSSDGKLVCGVACTSDEGCPTGSGCYGISGEGAAVAAKQCLPR